MDTTIDPSKAGMNPSTENPSINDAANMKIRAFNTKANKPKVMMVIGRVRMNKIGLTTKFNKPSINAAMRAI